MSGKEHKGRGDRVGSVGVEQCRGRVVSFEVIGLRWARRRARCRWGKPSGGLSKRLWEDTERRSK